MTADNVIKSFNITYNKIIVLPHLTEVLSKICDFGVSIEDKVKRYPYFDFSLM